MSFSPIGRQHVKRVRMKMKILLGIKSPQAELFWFIKKNKTVAAVLQLFEMRLFSYFLFYCQALALSLL